MTETLLAVAVRPSDGRVGTVSLPLPNTQPPLLSCCVPAPRWHQPMQLPQGCSLCYPHPQHFCYPLTPTAFLVLPLLPRQFPLFFTFLPFPDSDPSWELPQVTATPGDQGCSFVWMPPGCCMRQHAEGCLCQDLPVFCSNLAAGVMWSS